MNEMGEANETLWRSIDSSLDMIDPLSAEASFKSLAGSSDDVSEVTSSTVSPQKCGGNLEEGLLDALRNLKIASVRKTLKFRLPMISTDEQKEPKNDDAQQHLEENLQIDNFVAVNYPQSVDNPKDIKGLVENLLQQAQPPDLQLTTVLIEPTEKSIHVPIVEENESVIDDKSKGNAPANEKCGESIRTEPTVPISIAPEILDNMKKAMKPLLKPPNAIRKTTIGVSPMLQTRSRCRVTKTLSLDQLNQSTINKQTKMKVVDQQTKRSSSLKRQLTKNIVATVVSTKEGIKLKEEKIKNFGIPVNIQRKKKRTQAVPFSFEMRGKSSLQQQVQQKGPEKLPMRDSNSLNQLKQPVIIKPTLKENTLKSQLRKFPSQQIKFQSLTKSLVCDESMNKENRLMNLNKSKAVLGGQKLSTGDKLKERREFDGKVKQREKEIGEMRAQIELKKSKKEGMIDLELRKKIDSKVNPMPGVKIPGPVRSKKPLTTPQNSTLSLKFGK